MEDGPRAYTVAEAARRASVSIYTIRRLIAAGRLPSVKIGRLARVPAAAVAQLCEQGA